MIEEGVFLTEEDYEAFVIACHETEFGADLPDPAELVRDEQQRFLDSRIRLLTSGAAQLDDAVAAGKQLARDEARRGRETVAVLPDPSAAPPDKHRPRDESRRVRALAAFARDRPAALFDRAPGERGAASAASRAARPGALTDVSEWAIDEAAATLGISGRAASMMLIDAITLTEGLPATLAALSAGDISPAHARVMVEVAGAVADPDKRRAVEEAVLPRASRQTPAALRACVRRAVARI